MGNSIKDYENINAIKNPVLIRERGAIILDFNGVIYCENTINKDIIIQIIQLLEIGFRIIINTNNRADEILSPKNSLLRINNEFFLDYVSIHNKPNFIVYADNRTSCYEYRNGRMKRDISYSKDKGFPSNKIKNEIKMKLFDIITQLQTDENILNAYYDKKFPSYTIRNLINQLYIKMKMPKDYQFGNMIRERLYKHLEEYNIEIHIGRNGFYITIGGLLKSVAIKDAMRRFDLSPKYIIYIGDKYNNNNDSDLWCVEDCGITGFNVGNSAVDNMNIANIGKGVKGTLSILDLIVKNYVLPNYSHKYYSYNQLALYLANISNNMGRGIIIGINGPTGSGKTIISRLLSKELLETDKECIILQMDYFMYSREHRTRMIDKYYKNLYSINEYYKEAWNIDRFRRVISEIHKVLNDVENNTVVNQILLEDIYLRSKGDEPPKNIIEFNRQTIFIFEGTQVINESTYDYFDIKINIDANPNLLLDRIITRNAEAALIAQMELDFLINRYEKLDRVHGAYVRTLFRNNIDFAIDNSSIKFPIILQGDTRINV